MNCQMSHLLRFYTLHETLDLKIFTCHVEIVNNRQSEIRAFISAAASLERNVFASDQFFARKWPRVVSRNETSLKIKALAFGGLIGNWPWIESNCWGHYIRVNLVRNFSLKYRTKINFILKFSRKCLQKF